MDKFEEYKFLSQSTQFLTERRQAVAQTYLTVNTAVITVLAFVVKDAGFERWGLVAVSMPLFIFGILVCLNWQRIAESYRSLINWRYEQLMIMENSPDMSGSHQLYTKERGDYLPKYRKRQFGFSALERQLPLLVLALYVIFGLGMIVWAALA
jgi:hypothetical protein